MSNSAEEIEYFLAHVWNGAMLQPWQRELAKRMAETTPSLPALFASTRGTSKTLMQIEYLKFLQHPRCAGRRKPMGFLDSMKRRTLERKPSELIQQVRAFAKQNCPWPATWKFHDMRGRMNHARNYPAFELHPDIAKKHEHFWNMKAGAKLMLPSMFGKGRVLYTLREGGTWQKWPWNWIPDSTQLESKVMGFETVVAIGANVVPMASPRSMHDINVHSMLIDGKRWDCINGFTY